METKHTPEPWHVDNTVYKRSRTSINNHTIDVWYGLEFNDVTIKEETSRANAKRIVECVNAMEGVKNPSEFMEVVKKLELDAYKALEKKHADVIELLNTLDHLLSNGNSISPNSVIRTAIQVAVNSNI